ncbi:MAG: TRAP transporter large permease subunit [Deltaproteobacteria bacterium]|nr:TRAP transporter large permease subunit [Deltaproteobacteria bacterium]
MNSFIRIFFSLLALFFFVYLFRYYLTGVGGPTYLAVILVPVAFILFTLDALRNNELYPRLGAAANYIIGGVYIALPIVTLLYIGVEFEEIGTVRAGVWNTTDLVVGGLMVVLVMEYTRKRHFPLFILNVFLSLYAVYGWIVPGLFHHPGMDWGRILSSMSVEMATGVFSRLPQLALTMIGSFLLVLSVLRAFGCVASIINTASRIANKSAHALPQAAVLGSMAVGTVTGSGAANAITIGSATIPAMIASGIPKVNAAAIETAASLGGQLMPPVMGIAAFLMAEFLGVSYFEVVARGYAPALIYYAGVSVGVYLISVRYQTGMARIPLVQTGILDKINLLVYVGVIAGLIYLMGVAQVPPMLAALRVFVVTGIVVSVIFIFTTLRSRPSRDLRSLAAPFLRFIDHFTTMTFDLTLLLASLSIMTGVVVITGITTKVGFLLMEAAGFHLVAMILVAFFFGAIVGTGLPPAPTYILTALVIAPAMIKVGINPWVIHFFAFFVAVWGELTPPTSVVAAVTSKIADAPFMGTLFRGIQLCCVLFLLMGGVFARPELVLEPGMAQLGAMFLLMAGTVGIQFSIQAKYSNKRGRDVIARIALAGFSLIVVLHPSTRLATLAIAPIAVFVGYWVLQQRRKVL